MVGDDCECVCVGFQYSWQILKIWKKLILWIRTRYKAISDNPYSHIPLLLLPFEEHFSNTSHHKPTQSQFLFTRYLSRSILDDVRWLLKDSSVPKGDQGDQDPWFGPVRHASDYFPTIYEAAIYLIKNGLAYVDDLSPGRTTPPWPPHFSTYLCF